MNIDEEWMQYALQLAKKSEQRDEVPGGAIIVYKNKINVLKIKTVGVE